jgi:hypothetical protein
MGCEKLNTPSDTNIDTSKLPTGVSLPDGYASKANSGGAISNALKGAGNLIDQNVKSMSSALNPGAIGNAIGQVIGGIAGTIAGTVEGAISGVTGLADRLGGLGSVNRGNPNSPQSITSSVTPSGNAKQLSNLMQKKRCDDEYVKEAGKVNNKIKTKAKTKAGNLNNKQKKEIVEDETKAVEQRDVIAAEIAAETQEESAKEAAKEDKKIRTVQENLQSNILETVCDGTEKCDREILVSLLHQMSFYQTKMYNTLLALQRHTESILIDRLYQGRFINTPVVDLWSIIYQGSNFLTYSKLAKGLISKWDETCAEYKPVADQPFGTSSSSSTFSEYMKSTRTEKYGMNARVLTHAHDGVRYRGEKMLEKYFELWDESSWMLKDLNTDGATQDIIDAGLSGGGSVGLLGIPDIYSNVSDWYTQFNTHITGGTEWRSNIQQEMRDYVYQTQQPEILTRFNIEQDDGKVLLDVTNNTGQPQQQYERNFLIQASVNWSSLSISSLEYIGVDQQTKQVIET